MRSILLNDLPSLRSMGSRWRPAPETRPKIYHQRRVLRAGGLPWTLLIPNLFPTAELSVGNILSFQIPYLSPVCQARIFGVSRTARVLKYFLAPDINADT
jgi:hypothetical protein